MPDPFSRVEREALRDFLRAVPRVEEGETFCFHYPHGLISTTRQALTAAIEQLHPRLRQVARLTLEQRKPRQKVCDYLSICIKTLERDQHEALDRLLTQLIAGELSDARVLVK